jgi:hypothetical protein
VATVFFEGTGEIATLTNTFSVSGTATDPTTVSLTITTPSGTATTYTYGAAEITKSAMGVYTKDIVCSEAGQWVYAWVGTGTASDVVAGTWTVLSTDLKKLYCSTEELKSRLGISDAVDDFEVRLAVDAASRWIDGYCDRYFWRGTATRTFVADTPTVVRVGDLVSVTTLKTDDAGDGTFETTLGVSEYQLLPINATEASEARPYTAVRALVRPWPYYLTPFTRDDRVQIVGTFGWPSVPSAVKHAALIVAADCLKLKDAPFGVAGFGDFGAMRIRDNPRAVALLAPYRRTSVMVG